MIDAGHGGNDSGAICAYNPGSSKKYEKQINLLLAKKIKAKLEARGATVIMTRSDDKYVSLDNRAAMGRKKNPDMFIAVHCDSSESASRWERAHITIRHIRSRWRPQCISV